MKNLKNQYNQIPNDVVFNFNNLSEDEDILLELLIVSLIFNDFTKKEILKPTKTFLYLKIKKEMELKINNCLNKFKRLNPKYSERIKK